ncbi:MAG: hypothetical protein PF487_12510 [Bacteroidales bacterium]|jgi:hypothetical protein|nr:hypothetical protein [Bacteroidales bacterium]
MEDDKIQRRRSVDSENNMSDAGLKVPDAALESTEEDIGSVSGGSGIAKITINSLDYGFNVKIGCMNFAVETVEKLITNLEAYLKDPQKTETKWMKNKELL